MFNKENISIIYEKWPVPSVIIKRVFSGPCWTYGVITLGRIPIILHVTTRRRHLINENHLCFFPLRSFSRFDGCPHPEVDLLNTCFEESFMHKLATRPIVKYIWQSINTSDGWQITRLTKKKQTKTIYEHIRGISILFDILFLSSPTSVSCCLQGRWRHDRLRSLLRAAGPPTHSRDRQDSQDSQESSLWLQVSTPAGEQ